MEEQYVYHHSEPLQPIVNVKLIKNTKGYQWEITVQNCPDPFEALEIIRKTDSTLKMEYPQE